MANKLLHHYAIQTGSPVDSNLCLNEASNFSHGILLYALVSCSIRKGPDALVLSSGDMRGASSSDGSILPGNHLCPHPLLEAFLGIESAKATPLGSSVRQGCSVVDGHVVDMYRTCFDASRQP